MHCHALPCIAIKGHLSQMFATAHSMHPGPQIAQCPDGVMPKSWMGRACSINIQGR